MTYQSASKPADYSLYFLERMYRRGDLKAIEDAQRCMEGQPSQLTGFCECGAACRPREALCDICWVRGKPKTYLARLGDLLFKACWHEWATPLGSEAQGVRLARLERIQAAYDAELVKAGLS